MVQRISLAKRHVQRLVQGGVVKCAECLAEQIALAHRRRLVHLRRRHGFDLVQIEGGGLRQCRPAVRPFIGRGSGPYRLGDVFGTIFAALKQDLHGDEAAGPAGAVGAADGDADRVGPIVGDADRLAKIIPGDEFLLRGVPRDREHPHRGGWCLTFRHDVRPPGLKQLP